MINELIQQRMLVFNDKTFLNSINEFVKQLGTIIAKIKGKNKIFICGNGGSSSQASHFATELMVKYADRRNDYFALSLSSDTSVITAISNDFKYEKIFAMQLENLAMSGDILIVFSTSGKSENINYALRKASEMGLYSFALLGNNGGESVNIAKTSLIVPSNDIAIIQEFHLMVLHMICDYLEKKG